MAFSGFALATAVPRRINDFRTNQETALSALDRRQFYARSWTAGRFPLTDRLLTHLRRIALESVLFFVSLFTRFAFVSFHFDSSSFYKKLRNVSCQYNRLNGTQLFQLPLYSVFCSSVRFPFRFVMVSFGSARFISDVSFRVGS